MINQSETVGVKRWAKMIAVALAALVIAFIVFASTAFAGLLGEYNVQIITDGVATTVTTNETEPIEILTKANITLADNDKLDISGFEAGKGGKIVIDRQHTVNIEKDGKITSYSVYADTVGDALTEAGLTLGKNDQLNFELTDAVSDGMVIKINTAFTVTLNVDGKSTEFALVEGTVNDILTLANVQLGDDDYTEPSADASLKAGMKVNVYRVTYSNVTESEEVDYDTKQTKDSSLEQGKTKVVTKGVKGTADVTYKVKYVNGKEDSRTEVSKEITKEPVTQVERVGTKKVAVASNGVKSKNGYTVGQKISGRYTHYCACSLCNGNSRGITASGKKVYNGMKDPHYVACNWLPLGSVIRVDGTEYTVADRGGSGLSAQGRIDIFTPEGHAACYKYGTGSCTIEIVRLGW